MLARIKQFPLWCLPLSLALLFFPLKGVNTSPDSAWYLATALNIYKGQGYVDESWAAVLTRGPVFSGFIALSYWLFGVSVLHAFWVVRLFYILNILLIYAIGQRFLGKWAGVTAAFFVLTSFTLNHWSSKLLLDNVLPFFMLLSMLLAYLAFEKRRYLYFGLSGLILGLGFLVKEMALIFAPLPLLSFIFINEFRCKRNLMGVLAFLVALGIVTVPWVVYVYNISGDVTVLIGHGGEKVGRGLLSSAEITSTPNLFLTLQNYLYWLFNYYRQYLAPNFILAPLFVLAWLFTITRGILTKNKSDLTLSLALLLFSPLIIFFGENNWRAGQSMILYFLSYLSMTSFLFVGGNYVFTLLSRLFRQTTPHPLLARYLLASLICLMLGWQIGGEGKMVDLWLGKTVESTYGMTYYSASDWQVEGWHHPLIKKVGDWIRDNVPSNTKLMVDWEWRESIYYYAGGNYQVFQIPYLVYPAHLTPYGLNGISSPRLEKPLFLWSHQAVSEANSFLIAIREGDLLTEIKEKQIDYIVNTSRWNFLTTYFEENPAFEKVADWGVIRIFRVKDTGIKSKFKTKVATNVSDFLNSLDLENPAQLDLLKTEFFEQKLDLSETDIISIQNDVYPTFDPRKLVFPIAATKTYSSLNLTRDSAYIPNELIVGRARTTIDIALLATDLHAEIVDESLTQDAYLLRFEDDEQATVALTILSENDAVTYVERNWIVRYPHVPRLNLPSKSAASITGPVGLDQPNTWAIEKIQYHLADIPKSTPPCIGIFDTGINQAQTDFSERIFPGFDAWDNDFEPWDENGHGTLIARIAAGQEIPATYGSGISSNSHVLAVRVLGPEGWGTTWTVGQGILWANDQTASTCGGQEPRIYSLSLVGQENSQFLARAIGRARWLGKGRLVVAAAGNSNSTERVFPAAYDRVLSVGATDENDHRAWFSNYDMKAAPWVDIAAPGEMIYLSDASEMIGGTDTATPIVVGVAARMWTQQPELTVEDLQLHLRHTASPTKGFPRGIKRVNLYRALGGTSRTIQGQVVDRVSFYPLADVRIELRPKDSDRVVCTTTTNGFGFYHCQDLPTEGNHTISASRTDYLPIRRNFHIRDIGQYFSTNNLNLTMIPAPDKGASKDWIIAINWNNWQPFESGGYEFDLWLYDPNKDTCFGWSNPTNDRGQIVLSPDSYGLRQAETALINSEYDGLLQVWVTLWDGETTPWSETTKLTDSDLSVQLYHNGKLHDQLRVPTEPTSDSADNWYIGQIDLLRGSWKSENQIVLDTELPACITVPNDGIS